MNLHTQRLVCLVLLLSVLLSACASPAAATRTDAQPAGVQPTAEAAGSGRDPGQPPQSDRRPDAASAAGQPAYNLEQAISDRAQLNTIAFDAFAFLTGSLGADSFFPPGKVADFWGFQYLRDNDPSQMGHNTDFLTSAALNMLFVLTPEQRAELIALARVQVEPINQYGYRRFVLMDAFRRMLEGDLPAGTTGLDPEAVAAYSADLYALDGQISFQRAQVMGAILSELTVEQRAYLDAMVGQGMTSWPSVQEPDDLRNLTRDEKVAVMTYAGDMFSWYAGSLDADVYFCPERHGTYFGSFYLKDAPAVGNPGYSISTSLTGDLGEGFLALLDPAQAELVTSLVEQQRPYLTGMVESRRTVSAQLRLFMSGGSADQAAVLATMQQYGQQDGMLNYLYATNFARLGQSLSPAQQSQLDAMRQELLGDLSFPAGAYLYSAAIDLPQIPSTDFLFK